jgi:hypothetical protein
MHRSRHHLSNFIRRLGAAVVIVTAALVFTPVLHRLLHHFHWDDDEAPQPPARRVH